MLRTLTGWFQQTIIGLNNNYTFQSIQVVKFDYSPTINYILENYVCPKLWFLSYLLIVVLFSALCVIHAAVFSSVKHHKLVAAD